jgi:hypothetical protein
MKNYTFFFFRPGHPVPSFDIAICADDEEARSWAPRLARTRPHCRKLEVWDESRLIHRACWAEAEASEPAQAVRARGN